MGGVANQAGSCHETHSSLLMPSAEGTGKATNAENAYLWQSPEMSCFTASIVSAAVDYSCPYSFSAYIEVLSRS